MTTAPLLIELFTEELPPKALARLSEAFAHGIEDALRKDGLLTPESSTRAFATPRRLACRIKAVLAQAPNQAIREKLMPANVALTAKGQPSPALAKKLQAQGRSALLTVPFGQEVEGVKLAVEHDGKTEAVFLIGSAPGRAVAEAAQTALDATLAKLPIPKVMRYQLADGVTDVAFVRPVHGLIALFGETLLPLTAFGLKADRIAHGHRFQGAHNIEIDSASRYEELLRTYGKVEPDFGRRRAMIVEQLSAKAAELGASLGPEEDYAALLDEVTALVEWPCVYRCTFEPEYLAVPQECLILTMRTNQRYFPLFESNGQLRAEFLVVSNMTLTDPARIIAGNERVVRPRLADARFFFETDRKTRLEARVPELSRIIYHNKLGSQGERCERVAKIATSIAAVIGADPSLTERAARLAKADLLTLMVGEFPELQGIMGRHYALHDGEHPDVATACAEHYMPRFAGDRLPSPGVATALALADKLETLVGLFGIGQLPTGDKDPFALRRHALGVLRMLIERALPVDLPALLDQAAASFGKLLPDPAKSNALLFDFLFERLSGYLREAGHGAQAVEAVLATRPPWGDIPKRLEAVREFANLPEAQSLSAANKRVANILKKAQESGEAIAADPAVAREAAELALGQALASLRPQAEAAFARGDFTASLRALSALKAPVDAFFDQVMVMAEDPAVRANRLALLAELRHAMNQVADLSRLS